MASLDGILDYIMGANGMKKVMRSSNKPTRFQDSNADHSYQMIVMADILIEHFRLDLDFRKVTRYVYLHDIGEIGRETDICAWQPDGTIIDRKAKKQDERIVAHNFLGQYGLQNFAEIFDNYESQNDKESKFVRLLDKVEPMIFALYNGYEDFVKLEPYEFTIKNADVVANGFPELAEFVNEVKQRFKDIYNELQEK